MQRVHFLGSTSEHGEYTWHCRRCWSRQGCARHWNYRSAHQIFSVCGCHGPCFLHQLTVLFGVEQLGALVVLKLQQAPNASWFCSGCFGCEATFRLRRSSSAERGKLSSVSCMAARRLRGPSGASRMERIRRRCRVPDVSSQYLRRSHSACRRRTPARYTSRLKGFPVTAWYHSPSRHTCSASGLP